MLYVLLVLGVSAALIAAVFFGRRSHSIIGRPLGGSEGERILVEDALKYLFEGGSGGASLTADGIAGRLGVTVDRAVRLLDLLCHKELLTREAGTYSLSPSGREYGLQVIRAHRLWERYLADKTGVPEVDWHRKADQLEHRLSPAQVEALAVELGNPTHDPHGDPVPVATGMPAEEERSSFWDLKPGAHARITHVEDEPRSLFAELIQHDLRPGVEFRLVEQGQDSVVIWSEGSEKRISSVAAANLTVKPASSAHETRFESTSPLSALTPGEKGKVVAVSRASRAVERRRFMDLGILPGTIIESEFTAPGGDPTAYRIRGALIGLRREQAAHILVSRVEGKVA